MFNRFFSNLIGTKETPVQQTDNLLKTATSGPEIIQPALHQPQESNSDDDSDETPLIDRRQQRQLLKSLDNYKNIVETAESWKRTTPDKGTKLSELGGQIENLLKKFQTLLDNNNKNENHKKDISEKMDYLKTIQEWVIGEVEEIRLVKNGVKLPPPGTQPAPSQAPATEQPSVVTPTTFAKTEQAANQELAPVASAKAASTETPAPASPLPIPAQNESKIETKKDDEDPAKSHSSVEAQQPAPPVTPPQDETQYNRILNDARGTALGAALQANAATAKNALASLSVEAVDKLVKTINYATTSAATETAMRKLGLKTNQKELRDILNENRGTNYTLASDPLTTYRSKTYTDHAIRVHKNITKDGDRYNSFLEATLIDVQRAEKSLDPNLGNLKKLDDELYKVRLDLLQNQKFLTDLISDLKNPEYAAGADKNYTDHLEEMKEPADIASLEKALERKLVIIGKHIERADEIISQLNPILNGSVPQASTLSYFGEKNTKALYEGETYNEAANKVSDYLNLASPEAPDGAMQMGARKQFSDNILSTDNKNSIIATEMPIITENNTELKTATIHSHDETYKSAKSDFYFSFQARETFKTEKRIRREFPHSFPSVPGCATLEWASQNIKAFLLVMPNQNNSIRIVPGIMPKECTEALMIYCKFKGLDYTTPYNFSKKISDDQVKIFAKHWKEEHPEDLGKIEMQRVEHKIDKPSLKPTYRKT